MLTISPATGQVLRDVAEHDAAEVERRIQAAARAFPAWSRAGFATRAGVLVAAAGRLRDERERLARLITEEMGKPITQSESEVEKSAWACEHFAEHGQTYLANETIATDATRSVVRCDPLGPILAVMPWNFPFWQVFRAAAPALMAGNVMLLKHASNVPGCALAIEALLRDAGLPAGAFSALLIPGATAEALAEHPAIRAVTLTGSEPAGAALASRAGRAIRRSVLELGGSDAFIVLADADPRAVAAEAAHSRTIAGGQSCIAAKRFIVESPVYDRFVAALAERMARLTLGDPFDPATELGPLARPDLVTALERQVAESIARGARLVTGGTRPERRGFWYAPTVLAEVEPGMPVFDEETFGPVAAVSRARNVTHAVELANRSRYGLGASVWTGDPARGEALAPELEVGSVFVNGIVKSDPRLPFGGVKQSGYGRELAQAGIREFVNLKTVWVR